MFRIVKIKQGKSFKSFYYDLEDFEYMRQEFQKEINKFIVEELISL